MRSPSTTLTDPEHCLLTLDGVGFGEGGGRAQHCLHRYRGPPTVGDGRLLDVQAEAGSHPLALCFISEGQILQQGVSGGVLPAHED